MTKPITTIVALVAAAAATSGCSTMQRALGATKTAPDEFRIVTSAPLTLPPDYSLRPPRPGDPRPQELDPTSEAHAALFGQDTGQDASVGERALVTGAGAVAVDPNVRDQVDFEASGIVHRNENFADRVIQFQGAAADAAAPRDAEAEQAHVAEQESIRRATGGGTVTIERRGGGFKLPGT